MRFLYIYVFALIYLEFSYYIVVSSPISGLARMLICVSLSILLPIVYGIKIKPRTLCLFIYFILLTVSSSIWDGDIWSYLQLLVSITLSFLIVSTVRLDALIKAFSDLMFALAVYSLLVFGANLAFPALMAKFPLIGYVYETNAQARNAIFSVFLSNAESFRNYGIAWEPGAFAVLLCLALFCVLFLTEKARPGRITVFFITIFTTFSTTGYIAVLAILLIFFIERRNINKKVRVGLYMLLIGAICAFLFAPISIVDIVFAKLSGLSSGRTGSVAYTTQVRLDAIEYPLKAFFSRPLFGVGYQEFARINMEHCDGMATNTIANWFALMGIMFGLPCTYFYIKCSLTTAKRIGFCAASAVVLILFSIVLITMESFLRISLVYTLIFLGSGVTLTEQRSSL